MTRRLSIALAMTTALIGASSLYLLSPRGRENDRTRTDTNPIMPMEVEVERSAKAGERANGSIGPSNSASNVGRDNWFSSRLIPEQAPDPNMRTRLRYGELFRELGLSAQQIDALVPLLRAQDKRAAHRRREGELAAGSEAERERAAIGAVIGPDKGSQFERLRKTLPARTKLTGIRNVLEEAGAPLREDQREQLFATIVAQQPSEHWKPLKGVSKEENFARFQQWEYEHTKRFLEEAAPVLTPEQMKHLEDEARVRASVRMEPPGELGAAGARAPR